MACMFKLKKKKKKTGKFLNEKYYTSVYNYFNLLFLNTKAD